MLRLLEKELSDVSLYWAFFFHRSISIRKFPPQSPLTIKIFFNKMICANNNSDRWIVFFFVFFWYRVFSEALWISVVVLKLVKGSSCFLIITGAQNGTKNPNILYIKCCGLRDMYWSVKLEMQLFNVYYFRTKAVALHLYILISSFKNAFRLWLVSVMSLLP